METIARTAHTITHLIVQAVCLDVVLIVLTLAPSIAIAHARIMEK